MSIRRFLGWMGGLACAGLLCSDQAGGVTPIESGQYFSSTVATNVGATYAFYAVTNETVLLRLANEEPPKNPDDLPDCVVSDPDMNIISVNTHEIGSLDLHVSVTNHGWHYVGLSFPTALLNIYSNDIAYSISVLRMPGAKLSYADEDVGALRSGEALEGVVNVGADLDAGMFAVSNQCRMQIRMGQGVPVLVPQLRLYDPLGAFVMQDFPPEYRAEITTPVLTQTGIYTVVCNNHFSYYGNYVLSMVKIPGEVDGTDGDIGLIINGETKTGTINLPGDLDVAWFSAVPGDVVSIRMQSESPVMNPVMELYGPDMNLIAKATDIMQQAVAITNYTVTAGGKYTVILKDMEDAYDVKYSVTLTFVSGPSTESLPATPSGLSASDGTYADYIQVAWNPAAGALGYDLWRTDGTNDAIQVVTNHSKTTYSDYEVITNVYYYYKVKSRNSYGVSTNFSNTDSGWCGVTVIPVSDVRKAVVVGIDNYSPGYPGGQPSSLSACTNDAHGIRNTMLLGDPSNRWNAADVQLYTDRQATKTTLRNAMQSYASSSEAGDLILYTQSSHGGTNAAGDTFVCAYDENYYDYELAADLARFRPDTRVILIFDTCFSAGMFKDGRRVPIYWPFAERVMGHLRRIKTAEYRARGLPLPRDFGVNIAFMTASDYNEYSWEVGQNAIYTGYLLEACGLTSVDVSVDGNYSFKELHDYAAAKTIEKQPTQHPQFFNGELLSNTLARGVGVITPGTGAFIYNDFDADQYSELALYHEASGAWYIASLARGRWLVYGTPFGGPGWRPIAGDYDGDGYADPTLYNEALGLWTSGSVRHWSILFQNARFGWPGVRPIAGDYTGNGRFDGALYARDDNGFWYIVTKTGYVLEWGTTYTGPGYAAVPGDYDGDRIADFAMYHNDTGYWFIRSVAGAQIAGGIQFGEPGYIPVPGDYDGDGIFDLAVYHQAAGIWYAVSLVTQSLVASGIVWGGPGWQPVPGDYNGDGIYDLAVYNASAGRWMIRTISGSYLAVDFGGPGYAPVLPSLWND